MSLTVNSLADAIGITLEQASHLVECDQCDHMEDWHCWDYRMLSGWVIYNEPLTKDQAKQRDSIADLVRRAYDPLVRDTLRALGVSP